MFGCKSPIFDILCVFKQSLQAHTYGPYALRLKYTSPRQHVQTVCVRYIGSVSDGIKRHARVVVSKYGVDKAIPQFHIKGIRKLNFTLKITQFVAFESFFFNHRAKKVSLRIEEQSICTSAFHLCCEKTLESHACAFDKKCDWLF